MNQPTTDVHGNTLAREGLDRCPCGAKYWQADRCVSCGAKFDPGYCAGCGTTFAGERGLRAHQHSKFVSMDCKVITVAVTRPVTESTPSFASKHRFGSRYGSLPYGPMDAKSARAFAKSGVSALSGAFIAQAPEGGHYVGFGDEKDLHVLAYTFSTEPGSARSLTMIFPTPAKEA